MNILILKIVYLYLFFGIFLSIFNFKLPTIYIFFIVFFSFKWVFNYRNCTFTKLECLLRRIHHQDAIIYNTLEEIVDLRYTKHIIYILLISLWLIIYYFIIHKNKLNI